MPLFRGLRPHLDAAYELAEPGEVYVVGGVDGEAYRRAARKGGKWRNVNLRTQFERLVKRAGLTPWPSLIKSMRSSRETELVQHRARSRRMRLVGKHTRIALKHYLQVTDAEYELAIQGGAESGAQVAQNPAQHAAAAVAGTRKKRHNPLANQGVMRLCAMTGENVPDHPAERTGFEPADQFPGHGFSKPALSTTQPPLRSNNCRQPITRRGAPARDVRRLCSMRARFASRLLPSGDEGPALA